MADELEVLDDTELLNSEEEVVEKEDEEETIGAAEITEEDKEEKEDETEKKPDEQSESEDKPFPYERPSIQEIKKEFPDFFKKFPIFRDVVFREIEYTKMFPTIEDAKEAVEDNIAFNGLRDSVLSGNPTELLNAVTETDKKAAEKFALNFLPALHKNHNELYVATITPLFENLIRTVAKSENENQRNAALVMAKWLWGEEGFAIAEGKKTFARNLEESEDEKKLKKEREEFETSKYTEFRTSVLGEMQSGLAKMITRGLDPDNTMSERAKQTLVKEIIEEVDKAMASDSSHMTNMNARWLRSRKEGLNSASKEKIVSAYLSRAKQVIPSIRDKVRNDFLGVRKKTSEKKVEEITSKSSTTKEVVSGRSSNGSGKEVIKPTKELYRKMSDIDILNS